MVENSTPVGAEEFSVAKISDNCSQVMESEEDTTESNAGVHKRFVNYFGECNIKRNIMHATSKKGEIISLSEMCRKYLGINRDTAAVFTSYSKMRATFKRFLSNRFKCY